jgi:hypothetical protein
VANGIKTVRIRPKINDTLMARIFGIARAQPEAIHAQATAWIASQNRQNK